MGTMAVVTPTYAPDLELAVDLHASVLRLTADDVVHYLLVPPAQIPLFAPLAGPRCVVLPDREFLPRRLVPVPWANVLLHKVLRRRASGRIDSVNLRRPYPPIRGWVAQQLLKLSFAQQVDADVVVIADSDVCLVRPLTLEMLRPDGVVRMYRLPEGVTPGMRDHVAWHRTARSLLGLPEGGPAYTDYISSFNVWDASLVRGMLDRVERVTGRPWVDAIGGCMDFSEYTLYGTYVDEVLGAPANSHASDRTLCHSYWDTEPLTATTMAAFMAGLAEDDVAVLVQSKSNTPVDVRRAGLATS